MGQVVLPPRPQYMGESDEHYQFYLRTEYRNYLVATRDDIELPPWYVVAGLAALFVMMLVIALAVVR